MHLKISFFVMCFVLIIYANNTQGAQDNELKTLYLVSEDLLKMVIIAVQELDDEQALVIIDKAIKVILSSRIELNNKLIELTNELLSKNKNKYEL